MAKYRLDPKNARTHPERNRDAIGKSLRELGAGRSIVVDKDGVVIGGNCVYEKALELGLETEIVHTSGDKLVVVVRDDLATDDPRRKALALADNQIALLAEWDEAKLEEILGELGDIDLDVMGFDLPVEPLEEDEGAVSELIDRAEELQKKWKVKRGQIWEIPGKVGIHRVMCGDSRDEKDVGRLLGDWPCVDLLLIDPPYGTLKIFDNNGCVGRTNVAVVASYGAYEGEGEFDIRSVLSVIEGKWKKGVIWGGNYFADVLPVTTSWLCWDKRAGAQSWFSDFELAWTNLGIPAKLFAYTWQGMIREGERIKRMHPTQKPVPLMAWILNELAKDSETVLDLFVGSGCVPLAAEQESRICHGMEIAPKYVAVTLERLFALGLKPVRRDG